MPLTGDEKKEKKEEETPVFYEVEKILDIRKLEGQEEYKIQWKGYKTPTWEPAVGFKAMCSPEVQEMLEEFHRSRGLRFTPRPPMDISDTDDSDVEEPRPTRKRRTIPESDDDDSEDQMPKPTRKRRTILESDDDDSEDQMASYFRNMEDVDAPATSTSSAPKPPKLIFNPDGSMQKLNNEGVYEPVPRARFNDPLAEMMESKKQKKMDKKKKREQKRLRDQQEWRQKYVDKQKRQLKEIERQHQERQRRVQEEEARKHNQATTNSEQRLLSMMDQLPVVEIPSDSRQEGPRRQENKKRTLVSVTDQLTAMMTPSSSGQEGPRREDNKQRRLVSMADQPSQMKIPSTLRQERQDGNKKVHGEESKKSLVGKFPEKKDQAQKKDEMKLSSETGLTEEQLKGIIESPEMYSACSKSCIEACIEAVRNLSNSCKRNLLLFQYEDDSNFLHKVCSMDCKTHHRADEKVESTCSSSHNKRVLLAQHRSTDGNTPLHNAIETGLLCRVNVLLKQNPPLTTVNYLGESPLQTAYRVCKENKKRGSAALSSLLRLLLLKGASYHELLKEEQEKLPEYRHKHGFQVLESHARKVENLLVACRSVIYPTLEKIRTVSPVFTMPGYQKVDFDSTTTNPQDTFIFLAIHRCRFEKDNWTGHCYGELKFEEGFPQLNGIPVRKMPGKPKPGKPEVMFFMHPWKKHSRLEIRLSEESNYVIAAQFVLARLHYPK